MLQACILAASVPRPLSRCHGECVGVSVCGCGAFGGFGLHGGAPRETTKACLKGTRKGKNKDRGVERREREQESAAGEGRATPTRFRSMEITKNDEEHRRFDVTSRNSGKIDCVLGRGEVGGKKDGATFQSGRFSASCSCIGE